MSIHIRRFALPPTLLALTLSLVAAAAAAEYVYTAQTQAPAAQQGPVLAGGLTWACHGSDCTIKGPWEAPGVSACRALAGIVGPLKAYGRKGRMLGAADLANCNQATALAPWTKIAPQMAPPGMPNTGKQRAAGGIRTTGLVTPAISFRGTGAPLLPGRGADLGLVVTTPAISFQGTGALPVRTPIDPLTVTTPEMTFQGTGALE